MDQAFRRVPLCAVLVGAAVLAAHSRAAAAVLPARSVDDDAPALRKLMEDGQAAVQAGDGAKAMELFVPAVALSEKLAGRGLTGGRARRPGMGEMGARRLRN